MKAAAIDRFGSPSVLKLSELPVPKPAPNEVLIALTASGVGAWDADVRKGWWPRGRPSFPLVLATGAVGTLALQFATRCGARVSQSHQAWGAHRVSQWRGSGAEATPASLQRARRGSRRSD